MCVQKKRIIPLLLALAVLSLLSMGCSGNKDSYSPVSGLDGQRQVTLRIAIPYETNKALNVVSNAFMEKYQNVNIQLEYIENYDMNAVRLFKQNSLDIILQKDITHTEYTVVDKATGEKVPDGTSSDDYFYNFAADKEIDFSHTTVDITNNYRHIRTDADGKETVYQYCYPLGGEMRGIFVNLTLLDSLGLSVPTNYAELVRCCEVLKQAGYVAVQGTVSALAYGLGIAQAANTVVHDAEALEKMSRAEEGVSLCFEDTLSKVYRLAVNRYCDYKAIEGTGYFMDGSELGQARGFLGLSYDPRTFETVRPANNSGYVAFFPYLSSTETIIRGLIEENGLDTNFKFICSPLNDEDANSPVYITPYYGVCANKNSENIVWIREFINFLFQEDNIKTYARNASIIPNSRDALQYVADNYGLNVDTDITLCGQIKFSSAYNGFTPLADGLVSVAKCNAQKYMVELCRDTDGAIRYKTDEAGREFLRLGDGKTVVYKEFVGAEDPAAPGFAFCTLEYYLDALDSVFARYRSL
jgi:ABC-type glycerol-3-phosphate transport system substrate-binding protein